MSQLVGSLGPGAPTPITEAQRKEAGIDATPEEPPLPGQPGAPGPTDPTG